MLIVNEVLKDIPDDVALAELISEDTPVSRLILAYQDKTKKPLELECSFRVDLVKGLQSLPEKTRLALIKSYLDDKAQNNVVEETKPSRTSKTQEETVVEDELTVDSEDVRKSVVKTIWSDTELRRWIVKVVIISSLLILFLILGATIAIAVMTGNLDGTVSTTIMNTALEVMKIVFGIGN